MELEEGGTALLTCEISKAGVPVQWRKGSVLLRPGDKYKMKEKGCERQLQVHDVKCEDSGIYGCYADTQTTTATVLIKGMCNHSIDYLLHACVGLGTEKDCTTA